MAEDPKPNKLSQDTLVQNSKLEALGRLTTGIAHEINTPLQFVSDSAYYLRNSFQDVLLLVHKLFDFCKQCKTGGIDNELLEIIEQLREELDFDYLESNVPKALDRTLEGCEQVAIIVRAIKEFAYPTQQEKARTDLNKILLNTLTVVHNEYKSLADVQTDLKLLPMVLCHASEIGQVFLNLIVNAAHAIADQVAATNTRGTIRIASEAQDGEVEFSIADTGVGIPEMNRSRIFEPFFTAKKVGHGTGQGLSIARIIVVERHGGSIRFESQPGVGTSFFVRLPINGGAAATRESII
jgi:Signal transduction histidine kinase regulating C4-dicarboxylate transport system